MKRNLLENVLGNRSWTTYNAFFLRSQVDELLTILDCEKVIEGIDGGGSIRILVLIESLLEWSKIDELVTRLKANINLASSAFKCANKEPRGVDASSIDAITQLVDNKDWLIATHMNLPPDESEFSEFHLHARELRRKVILTIQEFQNNSSNRHVLLYNLNVYSSVFCCSLRKLVTCP